MKDIFYYQNYTPYVDLCVLLLTIVYAFLLRSTYTISDKRLRLFKFSNILVFVTSLFSILFNCTLSGSEAHSILKLYLFRDISSIAIALNLIIFIAYLMEVLRINDNVKKKNMRFCWFAFGIYVIWLLLSSYMHIGFYIDADGNVHQNYYLDLFHIYYLVFAFALIYLLRENKSKLISRMYVCFCAVFGTSFFIMILQFIFKQISFTSLTFALPLLAVLFMFHYNAYDATTGSLDGKIFGSYIQDMGSKEFTMLCVWLPELKPDNLEEISSVFYHFNENFLKDCCTFRIKDEKYILVFENAKNVNAALIIPEMYDDFKTLYSRYKLEYKINIIYSSPEIEKSEDYLLFSDFLEEKTPLNTCYECKREDVKAFIKANYILGQLHDISRQNNMDDERVLVYCQPVLNTETGTFTSAEALMRLNLPDVGLCYPDVFIPLAEKYDYIHMLSKIILNKTCKQIKALDEEGYNIKRISVNIAMSELKIADFCDEIKQIIDDNNISYDKIAIELTESMNESEFENVKHIMGVLHNIGMKFYLDDFGTGYSNIERIIKLPIDIIKFDRSLTLLAANDENSRHMVEGFTDIFSKSDYKILFEGIENDSDELQCRNMNALYLQGYKYSKPIPIEQLKDFLVCNEQ